MGFPRVLPMPARTLSGILADIIQKKAQEIELLREHALVLEQQAYERTHAPRPFAEVLRSAEIGIIAEIKKASPSRGLLAKEFHPARLAGAYERGGATCLSVLTDHTYFQGSLHDLEVARAAATVPVLRKDFTIDRVQIFQSAAHGADAILLIAAILSVEQLRNFRELASTLGMAALVEVHDQDELAKAIDSGAELIGVNNRDLQTFEVSLNTSLRLSYLMPSSAIRVSESGIHGRTDIDLLRDAGFNAFLIGESLMRSHDPARALNEILGKHNVAAD
jgi:indole-3-glycerol phosphate synthase